MESNVETAEPCLRCRSPLAVDDLRCAVCGAIAAAREGTGRRDGIEVRVVRCSACGAATRFDPDAGGVRCAFCAAVTTVELVPDPLEQTEAWLPFTVGRAEARAALQRWLGGLGFFRPSDLRSEARLESLRPLMWVGWAFDATATISWTADSDAGARNADWAPHAGQVEMVFDDIVVSASRGLSAGEADVLARHYDLATAVDVAPPFDPDTSIEQFDVQRSQARQRIVEAIDAVAGERVTQACVPGRRSRNVRTKALLRGVTTRRIALPAWIVVYRYQDESYRVVVCGQDASCVVGRAPWSVAKIVLAVLMGLALLALIVVVIAAAAAS